MSQQLSTSTTAKGVETNLKAIAFQTHLIDQNIASFQTESTGDDYETVIFRSRLEVHDVLFPFAIFIDKTLFVLMRVQILTDVLKERHEKIIMGLNAFNAKYRIFKYFLHPKGTVYLDIFFPTDTEDFNPETLEKLINITGAHLRANYEDLMRTIWRA